MDIRTLQNRLLEAYSTQNLNKISLTLIELYKNEQFEILQKMADIIGDFVTIEIDEKGKGFSRFMMLYHPDRADFHTNEINRLAADGNFDELLNYSHILKLERIEEIANSLSSFEDIDYSPVYEWDVETEGFSTMTDREQPIRKEKRFRQQVKRYSFYDAIKIRYYGHTKMEYPSYYLEDIEEFELSGSGINDLDGIQYCRHTRVFDLSENYINDLWLLAELTDIEELNLADNQLDEIDVLACLTNLRSVTLSDNRISNIEPLFELEHLEYADLTGNKISSQQLETLRDLGVTIDC
jgi:Leucine-rich repeat (LRR) protein